MPPASRRPTGLVAATPGRPPAGLTSCSFGGDPCSWSLLCVPPHHCFVGGHKPHNPHLLTTPPIRVFQPSRPPPSSLAGGCPGPGRRRGSPGRPQRSAPTPSPCGTTLRCPDRRAPPEGGDWSAPAEGSGGAVSRCVRSPMARGCPWVQCARWCGRRREGWGRGNVPKFLPAPLSQLLSGFSIFVPYIFHAPSGKYFSEKKHFAASPLPHDLASCRPLFLPLKQTVRPRGGLPLKWAVAKCFTGDRPLPPPPPRESTVPMSNARTHHRISSNRFGASACILFRPNTFFVDLIKLKMIHTQLDRSD